MRNRTPFSLLLLLGCVFAFPGPSRAGDLIEIWAGLEPVVLDQVVRGHERYRAMCARCHGHRLLTKYAEVPSLTGYAFDTHWRGRTVGELYDRIRVTMPAMGPQLDPQLSIDITAYILAFNRLSLESVLPPDEGLLYRLDIPEAE